RQADSFASSLLMPEGWVRIVWRDLFSRSNALIFSALQDSNWANPPMGWQGLGSFVAATANTFDPRKVGYFFYRASKPMADAFDVSAQAIGFRLEQFGLLFVNNFRKQSLVLGE